MVDFEGVFVVLWR